MDRRILVVVALMAMGLALVLGWALMPAVDTAPPAPAPVMPAPEVARAPVPAPVPVVRPKPVPEQVAADGTPELKKYENSPGVVGGQSPIKPRAQQVETDPEVKREYRCRALGQQADVLDKLVVIAGGGAVDEDQKLLMVSRIAELSTTVLDQGEDLWSGELACDDIRDVNLGGAADFLAQVRDEMDLTEQGRQQIDQALSALDTVEWPEPQEVQ